MAYGGGYLVKPVQSKMGSVADLYLQGQAQVQQIQKEVRDERTQQLKVLGKATNFEATGIQDMDKYWAGMGNQTRTNLAKLHEMNRRGEISRSEVIARSQALTSEMEMVGQIPTLTKSRIDEMQKEIDKDKLSQLSLDTYTATWFKDANASLTGIKVYDPATGQKRNLQSNYSTEIVDDKAYMKTVFEYVEGQDENGKDIIKTASILKPVRNHVDPNQITIKKVDDKKAVAEWAKNLGDQNFVYTDANGVQQVVGYQNMQRTSNGTNILGRISDPADVNRVSKVLETEVNGKSDEFYLSYAYDVLGARAPFHSGGGKSLTKDQWESRFPSSVYFDYDANTKKGTPLTFTKDPLTMEFDSAGNSSLSEETLKLVKSHYRNQLMASIDVDSDVYKDRSYKSGTKTTTLNSASAATYTVKGKGRRVDGNNFSSRAAMSQMQKNSMSGKVSVNVMESARSLMSKEGSFNFSDVKLPEIISNLNNPEIYDQTTQGEVNFGGVMKDFASQLNVNTFTDNKFKDITGYYSAEDDTGQPYIVLVGSADYGTVDVKSQGTGEDQSSIEKTVKGQSSIVSEGFSNPLTDTQAQNLYKALWDPKTGNKRMQDIFKNLGYNVNSGDHKLALHLAQDKLNQ